MSDKKRKVPKLRFPGFTDSWEQRKLGEIAKIIGGGTPSTSNPEYWDGGIDWYSPAEIGSQIYVSKSVRQISDLGLQKSSAKLLPEGSVLFTSRAGIGNTAILAKESCTNQGFQSIVPNKGMLDTYFIFSQSHALKKYGETVGAGSTFVEVSGKQMERMDISLPIIQEQEKIGAYFKQMDSLLSLHQRKLDNVKMLKKSLLQKLFPKDGEKTPELRFPGFTDAWEQRKLGAIFQKNEEKNQLGIGSEKTISIASMSYKEEGNGANVDSLRGYKILRIGDIAFEGHTNKSFRFGRFILNDLGTGIMSPRFTSLRPTQKINIHFWKHYIHYEPVMRDILVRSTKAGTMMNELVISEFEKSEIAVPNSHEQVAIGKLFNHYDTLLSLHQRKLDHLKELKKGLLQQMFV